MTAISPVERYDGRSLTGLPDGLALADWRRRVSTLYAEVRAIPDPDRAWRHWAAVRSYLYRAHPMSPVPQDQREGWGEIPMFDYDPALRFEVDTTALDGAAEDVGVGADGSLSRKPVARTVGLQHALGAELTLWWIGGYGGGVFLPFKDKTSGTETYGGGRYLLDAVKSADLGLSQGGRLILDFNFSYTPSCALNPAYVCPLSPPENMLPAEIRAGERIV